VTIRVAHKWQQSIYKFVTSASRFFVSYVVEKQSQGDPMKRGTILQFAWLAVLGAVTCTAQTRYLVRPAPTGSIGDIDTRHGLTLVGPLDDQNRGVYVVTAPSTLAPTAVITDVSGDAEVTDFELDSSLAIAESPSSLNQTSVAILESMPAPTAVSYYGSSVLGLYLDQPATSIIRLPDAQTTFGVTGAGIVAVIDTGIDPNHVALQGALVPGYDFVNNIPGSGSEMTDLDPASLQVLQNSNPDPASKTQQLQLNQTSVAILEQTSVAILETTTMPAFFGHGTMVAGMVHLVAPGAQIMPLKAFQSDGTASLSDILRAIYYAADHGANVINMSFTLLTPSSELEDAIGYAANRNVTTVASTGNTGTTYVAQPAALQKVIGVASTSNADLRSTFSSYGTGTFVAAPGEQVITLYPGNNYAVASGTSFSSPMVAGTAALTVQVFPVSEFSNTSKAISQAKNLGTGLGYGRLDVYQAVQYATQHPSIN
jgi:subtilisin family serine protease